MALLYKRISQLEPLADSVVTGEAFLPIIISDPLIPNRKAKINQLFKGVSAGSKTNPGLAFDLDRDTGLYQSAVNEIGISFGTAALYNSRTQNTDGSSTIVIRGIDTFSSNSNIQITPQGSGYFTVNGSSRFTDSQFFIIDDQNPGKLATFEVSGISTGSGVRRFALPNTGSFTSTTLLGNDTVQTITNKSLIIKDNEFSITGSSDTTKIARFECDAWEAPGTKIYRLPDFGVGPGQSTLIDDISTQNVFNKNLVNPTFSNTPSTDPQVPTRKVSFDTSGITQNRTVTFPDLNVILVGTDASQTLTNKVYKGAIFSDTTFETKKVSFDISNVGENRTIPFRFPAEDLNTLGVNTLVSTLASQTLANKVLEDVQINNPQSPNGIITIDASNITEAVTIKFPNANAELLSTNNVGQVGVSFGGPISAPAFGGKLRLINFFQSGW